MTRMGCVGMRARRSGSLGKMDKVDFDYCLEDNLPRTGIETERQKRTDKKLTARDNV